MMANSIEAQNNPYKINDKIYGYYTSHAISLKSPRYLCLCDTMQNMAVRLHDKKAICWAWCLRAYHYDAVNDPASVMRILRTMKAPCVRYHYLQYYFGVYNLIVLNFIEGYSSEKAEQWLESYRKEAFALNSSYGKSFYYVNLGNIFMIKNQYKLALDDYLKAIDIMKSENLMKEAPQVYRRVAMSYCYLGEYDKSIKCIEENVLSKEYTFRLGFTYTLLADDYFAKDDVEKGMYYYHKSEEWTKKYENMKGVPDYFVYLMHVYYYIAKNDYVRALAYCDSLKNPLTHLHKADIYVKMNDYKKAYYEHVMYLAKKDQIVNLYNDRLLAEYDARFNNQQLETEKNELEIKNSHYLIDQLEAKQKLMTMDRERQMLAIDNSGLVIRNKNLSLKSQKAEMLKQKAMAKYEHERAKSLEIISTKNRHLNILLFVLLCFIVTTSVIYAILRRRTVRRLQHGMRVAERARRVAERAQQQLIEANKQKGVFLQDVSHEIRTPLNSIVGFTNLLTDPNSGLSDEEKRQFTKLINTNSALLTTLVNDVLDLSRLENDKYKINYGKVDINEMCTDVINTLADRVPAGVKMTFEKPANAENAELCTDESRTREVLMNFMTNACKYTVRGRIVLAYEMKDGNVIFSVTDTGCGISPENAEKVFDRFEKLDTFVQGTGIGLSICKRIAELLHGEVKLDTTYHDGARFLFIHPQNNDSEKCV
jgi:signal transduction histidine kinase